MSVFTTIPESTIRQLLQEAGLTLIRAQPAHHGMENSNYLLEAKDGQGAAANRVLTLFDSTPASQLPWIWHMLEKLAGAGLAVPEPIAINGKRILTVCQKPAFLVPWLAGSHPTQASTAQCQALGAALARIHQTPVPANPDAPPDCTGLAQRQPLLALLPEYWRQQAKQLLAQWQPQSLPITLIHSDLFRDNVLFCGDRLSGLLDFYDAGHGPALYDLAVCLNDWCMPADRDDPALVNALLSGYLERRALSARETEALPLARAMAALRFWLSRLDARQKHSGQENDLVLSKDPAEMARRFQFCAERLAG